LGRTDLQGGSGGIFAFALVGAFPYLPGAGSPALAGVSVLAGVSLSLAASSSLSSMVAGLVLTYAGAFRVGDRVQVGDVVERGLTATRVRTPRNEEVIVPNSVVLGGQIINYSSIAAIWGLILHTSVTIGYDAPWRQVHGSRFSTAFAQAPRRFPWVSVPRVSALRWCALRGTKRENPARTEVRQ
jgi:small-conductance mechanosensitive channel